MDFIELGLAWRYIRSKHREKFISITAIFSLIGVVLGVATLIIVTSVMNGFKEEFTSRVVGFNGHLNLIANGTQFELADVIPQIERIPGVMKVVPVIERQGLLSNNKQISGTMTIGISQNDLRKFDIVSKNLNGDVRNFESNEQIIIGRNMQQKLNARGGDPLAIIMPQFEETAIGSLPRKKTFELCATFSSGMNEYDSNVTIIPIELAQKLFKVNVPATMIMVFLQNANDISKVKSLLLDQLNKSFFINDWQQTNSAFMQAITVERNVMFLILTLITLVASFSIITCMIMLVKDKEKEIAVLRTIGVSQGGIVRIFFVIGSSIGVIGTLVGATAGLLFSLNIESIRRGLEKLLAMDLFPAEVYYLTQLPAIVDYSDVMAIVLFALLISCLATLYPARKASKIRPAEILRYA